MTGVAVSEQTDLAGIEKRAGRLGETNQEHHSAGWNKQSGPFCSKGRQARMNPGWQASEGLSRCDAGRTVCGGLECGRDGGGTGRKPAEHLRLLYPSPSAWGCQPVLLNYWAQLLLSAAQFGDFHTSQRGRVRHFSINPSTRVFEATWRPRKPIWVWIINREIQL